MFKTNNKLYPSEILNLSTYSWKKSQTGNKRNVFSLKHYINHKKTNNIKKEKLFSSFYQLIKLVKSLPFHFDQIVFVSQVRNRKEFSI